MTELSNLKETDTTRLLFSSGWFRYEILGGLWWSHQDTPGDLVTEAAALRRLTELSRN